MSGKPLDVGTGHVVDGPFNSRGDAQDALYNLDRGDKNELEITYDGTTRKWFIVKKGK